MGKLSIIKEASVRAAKGGVVITQYGTDSNGDYASSDTVVKAGKDAQALMDTLGITPVEDEAPKGLTRKLAIPADVAAEAK